MPPKGSYVALAAQRRGGSIHASPVDAPPVPTRSNNVAKLPSSSTSPSILIAPNPTIREEGEGILAKRSPRRPPRHRVVTVISPSRGTTDELMASSHRDGGRPLFDGEGDLPADGDDGEKGLHSLEEHLQQLFDQHFAMHTDDGPRHMQTLGEQEEGPVGPDDEAYGDDASSALAVTTIYADSAADVLSDGACIDGGIVDPESWLSGGLSPPSSSSASHVSSVNSSGCIPAACSATPRGGAMGMVAGPLASNGSAPEGAPCHQTRHEDEWQTPRRDLPLPIVLHSSAVCSHHDSTPTPSHRHVDPASHPLPPPSPSESSFAALCHALQRVDDHRLLLLRAVWEYLRQHQHVTHETRQHQHGESGHHPHSSSSPSSSVLLHYSRQDTKALGHARSRRCVSATSQRPTRSWLVSSSPSHAAADAANTSSAVSSSGGGGGKRALSSGASSSRVHDARPPFTLLLGDRSQQAEGRGKGKEAIDVVCSRSVYRSLLAGQLAAASALAHTHAVKALPLGQLPSASFVLVKAALPMLIAEVFVRYVRYQSILNRERRALLHNVRRHRSLVKAFVGWRGVVRNRHKWAEAVCAAFVRRLQQYAVLRCACRAIVRDFAVNVMRRREARHAVEGRRVAALFAQWRGKARAAITAAKLAGFAKAHMGRESWLLRLALQPTRAITAVRAVIATAAASSGAPGIDGPPTTAAHHSNGDGRDDGDGSHRRPLAVLTSNVPVYSSASSMPYRPLIMAPSPSSLPVGRYGYADGNENSRRTVPTSSSLSVPHPGAHDGLVQRPSLTAIAPKAALKARWRHDRAIPKHHHEYEEDARMRQGEGEGQGGVSIAQYRSTVQRIVFGHWRVQLQRRRDLRDAAVLSRQHDLSHALSHWRRRALVRMSQRELEQRRAVEARRAAYIANERVVRGEHRPLRRRRGSLGLHGDAEDDGLVSDEHDDDSDGSGAVGEAARCGFVIVTVPPKTAATALVGAHADSAADTTYYLALSSRVLRRWSERCAVRAADRHYEGRLRAKALARWHAKMQTVTAHARIKGLLFNYWRDRLRQYRMRLLADDWRRSHVARGVLAKWQEAAAADRQRRQFTLRSLLGRWAEAARVSEAQRRLAVSKGRRVLLAWRNLVDLRRYQAHQEDLAAAVRRRVACVKAFRQWRTRLLMKQRDAVLAEMTDSIRSRRMLSAALQRWMLRTAGRRQTVSAATTSVFGDGDDDDYASAAAPSIDRGDGVFRRGLLNTRAYRNHFADDHAARRPFLAHRNRPGGEEAVAADEERHRGALVTVVAGMNISRDLSLL